MDKEILQQLMDGVTSVGILLIWVYLLRADLQAERKFWREMAINKLDNAIEKLNVLTK